MENSQKNDDFLEKGGIPLLITNTYKRKLIQNPEHLIYKIIVIKKQKSSLKKWKILMNEYVSFYF